MDKEKQLELLKSDLIIAQNKLNDIQKNFIALSDELEKEKKSVWKPYDIGFMILYDGSISSKTKREKGDSLHNFFQTEELAKLRQKQREAEDELFNIWESLVGDWRPDWTDMNQRKYFVNYDSNRNPKIKAEFNVSANYRPMYYYFPAEELAMKRYEMASEHAKAYIRGEVLTLEESVEEEKVLQEVN